MSESGGICHMTKRPQTTDFCVTSTVQCAAYEAWFFVLEDAVSDAESGNSGTSVKVTHHPAGRLSNTLAVYHNGCWTPHRPKEGRDA